MLELFSLIRIRTIAFAALTMCAMRYWVMQPILGHYGCELQMTLGEFVLLIIAIGSLISAAYVINDYFDMKPDRISGVRNVVIGKSVSRRAAITLHTVLNIISVAIAFYLGFSCGVWEIGILFLLVSGLLWFYSSVYKKYFLLGNIVVGLLAALIPVSAIIYEIPLLNQTYADLLAETNIGFIGLFYWVFVAGWFIFLNTLMYEINKDIFSVGGDRENGIRTIPVRLSRGAARVFIDILAIVAASSAIIIYWPLFLNDWQILAYLLVAVVIPYIAYLAVLNFLREKRSLQLNLIRLLMVTCVGASFFLRHFFDFIFS